MTTTTILLIRHGETDWNLERRWQGHVDVPLNATGWEQARALANRLNSWPIKALYSSDLQRASQTAAVLGERLSLTPVPSAHWRERYLGLFQGMTIPEIVQKHPDAWETGILYNPPQGETWQQVADRTLAHFTVLCDRHLGEMIGVVTHGGVLRVLLATILGLSLDDDNLGSFTLRGNTGLSTIEINENRKMWVTRLNDTAHLEPPYF